jgi:rhodanese-related sulfurtransferase
MDHSPGFLKLVEAKRRIVKEIPIGEARRRLAANPGCVLLDVREDHEWRAGHAIEAVHLGRGILERDLERLYPDASVEFLMYCGGGFRSVLAVATAKELGYANCHSIIGGYKGMVGAGWPMQAESQ